MTQLSAYSIGYTAQIYFIMSYFTFLKRLIKKIDSEIENIPNNKRLNIMRKKPYKFSWKMWIKALPTHRFMLTHWGMNKIAKFYRWHFRMHFLVRKLLPFDSHITMFHKGSALAYVGMKPSPEPIDLIPDFIGVYMCHHRSISQRNNELIIMQQIILFQSLFWRLNPPTSKGHGKCNVKT